jgi:hypothetical protein
MKGRDHLEELHANGRTICIRMDLREIWWEVADCMHLAWYRCQWQVLVNAIMKLRPP